MLPPDEACTEEASPAPIGFLDVHGEIDREGVGLTPL